ncbi:MAG TPA: hypothetical protein VEQ65_07955 [Opitutus sp.]|nr:hypothetical protein [Opitutus sp.]
MKSRALLILCCAAVALVGVTWQAWDMFDRERRSMLQGWDDSFYYFWLPSVVIDGDVDFANQLAQADSVQPSAREDALAMPRTDTGLVANKYPPGWALGSLPFFLVAHVIAPAGATGFEPVYLVAVWLGQLVYAVVGLWLCVQLVRRYVSGEAAVTAVLVVWLASPLVYYQSARLSMSHSQVFVLAVALFWVALRIAEGDTRYRTWGLWGFVAAMLVVTRNVAVVYLAMPALVVSSRIRLKSLGALVLGAMGPLAVQVIAWRALYGSWLTYSYGGERFDFSQLHLAKILFSPLHGWFYWHPLLLPAIAAFTVWAVRSGAGRAWLVSLAAILWLNAAWPTWWLGSSFGYRGLEVPVFFAMIGLAKLFAASHTKPVLRRGLVAVASVAVAWNLALFALFLTQRIPRQEPVTYGDTARALGRWLAGDS